jgi:hypothetical protein
MTIIETQIDSESLSVILKYRNTLINLINSFKPFADGYYYIYGGFIRDLIAGFKPVDIDIAFTNDEDKNRVIKHLYKTHDVSYESSWVTRYKSKSGLKKSMYDLASHVRTPHDFLTNSDYANNSILFDSNYDLFCLDSTISANVNRELILKPIESNSPMILAYRAGKLIQKGFVYKSENPSVLVRDIEAQFELYTNPINIYKVNLSINTKNVSR